MEITERGRNGWWKWSVACERRRQAKWSVEVMLKTKQKKIELCYYYKVVFEIRQTWK